MSRKRPTSAEGEENGLEQFQEPKSAAPTSSSSPLMNFANFAARSSIVRPSAFTSARRRTTSNTPASSSQFSHSAMQGARPVASIPAFLGEVPVDDTTAAPTAAATVPAIATATAPIITIASPEARARKRSRGESEALAALATPTSGPRLSRAGSQRADSGGTDGARAVRRARTARRPQTLGAADAAPPVGARAPRAARPRRARAVPTGAGDPLQSAPTAAAEVRRARAALRGRGRAARPGLAATVAGILDRGPAEPPRPRPTPAATAVADPVSTVVDDDEVQFVREVPATQPPRPELPRAARHTTLVLDDDEGDDDEEDDDFDINDPFAHNSEDDEDDHRMWFSDSEYGDLDDDDDMHFGHMHPGGFFNMEPDAEDSLIRVMWHNAALAATDALHVSTGVPQRILNDVTSLQVLTQESSAVLNASRGCCAICMEDYAAAAEIRRLPCMCVFHRACVDRHFAESFSCPMCRTSLSKAVRDTERLM